VAHVAFRILLQAGTGAFDAVDLVAGEIAAATELYVVEHEELGLGTHRHAIANAGRFHIGRCLLGGAARVAGVGLAGGGLIDVAEDDQ
jgi:hypothetical protein